MIDYCTPAFAKRDHQAQGERWDEWHVDGDSIQRCLLDGEGFLLATEILEGDVTALVAFARIGSDLTTHDLDLARKLERLRRRQTQQLLRAMRKSML